MKSKKKIKIIICIMAVLVGIGLGIGLFLWRQSIEWPGEVYEMDMHTDFPKPENLPDGDGERVKVILLLGQSNATGIGHTSCLQENLNDQQYARYEGGFDSVWINYCVDNHRNCSDGEFVSVDLNCAVDDGYFGPEVGMAEKFAEQWPGERIVILKYTYSGTSLYYRWLSRGERGSIYQALEIFVNTYMQALLDHNYDARIGAVCWMQGESDTADKIAKDRYYNAQTRLISYLREDFTKYAEDGGICFIDAGISDSPLWTPGYADINKTKEEIAKDSDLNYYFSTIDAGLTYNKEPQGAPDLAHYDSMSVLRLGHLFGEYVIQAYRDHHTK